MPYQLQLLDTWNYFTVIINYCNYINYDWSFVILNPIENFDRKVSVYVYFSNFLTGKFLLIISMVKKTYRYFFKIFIC